jgi:hypothetical protein
MMAGSGDASPAHGLVDATSATETRGCALPAPLRGYARPVGSGEALAVCATVGVAGCGWADVGLGMG